MTDTDFDFSRINSVMISVRKVHQETCSVLLLPLPPAYDTRRLRRASAHSTRTPTSTSLLLPSHGDEHCDDPRPGATFGRQADSNTLTGYEPNDLIEMNNTEITLHRYSSTARA